MTTKSTPGPWIIQSLGPGLDHDERFALWPDDNVKNRHNLIADINGAANAALIAAAPDLLAALESMVGTVADVVECYRDLIGTDEEPGWIYDHSEALKQARAAIARAKGEK